MFPLDIQKILPKTGKDTVSYSSLQKNHSFTFKQLTVLGYIRITVEEKNL